MIRAVAMSATSVFCLVLAAGCASTSKPATLAAAAPAPVQNADVAPDPNSDIATLARNLPGTLDGEIRRAQLLRMKGDYEEAAHSLAQLILFAPDDGRVVGEYGKVLEQQGHSKEAVAFLKRAVELQPRDWALHSALGVAYDQLDDRASARTAYERALALKPGDPSVLNNFGVSRMLAGDYPAARRLFAEAAAQGAPNPKIALNLDKLADMNPPHAPAATVASAPKPSLPVQKPDSHVTVVTNAQPVAAPKVVMQHVPADPLATRAAAISGTSAAKPLLQNQGAGGRVATSAPKSLGPQVVMQRVPVDPLAGPVVRHRPTRLAAAPAKPKSPADKPAATTPSLRTAADAN